MNTQRDVLIQLYGFIDQLRAIIPPKREYIGSTDYTPINDDRVTALPWGPFDNISDFHRAIPGGFDISAQHDELEALVSAQDSRVYHIKLTHSDLSF